VDLNWRFATAADLQALAELNHQLIADEGHDNPMTLPELRARMAEWLADDYKAVLFERAHALLGYALYRTGERNSVHLRQFFVARDARRRGVGRRAIELLMREVLPGKRVVVEVLTRNDRGAAFWLALGFQDYARTLELRPRSEAGDRDAALQRARVLRQSYDRIAPRFVERWRDRTMLYPRFDHFTAALPPHALVLDLGAGPCLDSAELRGRGLAVVSVDSSAQMLRALRAELPGPRLQADMRSLPFRAACFAGVWANASLLHLDRSELVPVLREVRRVLLPAGVLHVSLKQGSGEGWETLYGADAPRWFTFYSESEVDSALAAAGFAIEGRWREAGANAPWLTRFARAPSVP
jgi:SAM-dependent methyltransferase